VPSAFNLPGTVRVRRNEVARESLESKLLAIGRRFAVGGEMNSNKVASALKRQKELLEQVFDLAECQVELLETERVEDLEVLLSLRGGLLSELAVSDEEIDPEMWQIRNDHTLTTEQLDELHSLNQAILQLADRIAKLDEEAEWLAEHPRACSAASSRTETAS
jgi:hypothetical protein